MKSTARSEPPFALALALPLVLVLVLVLPGCGGRVGGGGEVIVVEPQPSAIFEIEPNDDAWTAQPIGSLRAGDALAIEGHITECCPDPADGFAFYAEEPLELRFALHAYEPADLDFCIFDPYEQRYLACFESALDPELGTFLIGGPGEFHVVVGAWAGDAHYRLEVEALPLGHAVTLAPEPATAAGPAFAEYATPPLERELKKALRGLLGLPEPGAAEEPRDRTDLRAGRPGRE